MPRASGDSFARPDNAKDTFSPPYSYPANGVFPSVLHPISPLSPSPWATSGHMNCYNGTAMGQSGPGTFLGPTQGPVTMGAAANPMANTQMQVSVEGFGSHIHFPSINYSPRGTFNEAPTTRPTFYPCLWLYCTQTFQRHRDFKRHVITLHISPGSYACPHCEHISNRKDNLKSHLRNIHRLQLQESHAGTLCT
ncbi:hypothetical protein ASPCADRAFT_134007 [Aspergillus carbonarius ITEM 5010]|uniref:C2H2-type domain-containing protein n=1 Tax=Aspergillus carbonarius (strain ITEM 5010) TaxID=602072 RepID=A0A1R3RBV2_ASPC5|nr:hypothetical protein ASPCADRAFT_134007 [Aspergillus carbonarius ITEM 5010]